MQKLSERYAALRGQQGGSTATSVSASVSVSVSAAGSGSASEGGQEVASRLMPVQLQARLG